jgi:hypothetical protein
MMYNLLLDGRDVNLFETRCVANWRKEAAESVVYERGDTKTSEEGHLVNSFGCERNVLPARNCVSEGEVC